MSAGGASGGQGVPAAAPTPLPSHAMAPLPSHAVPPPTAAAGNALLNAAREQERVYMELLSRPPYNSDPILAQQVCIHTVTTGIPTAPYKSVVLVDHRQCYCSRQSLSLHSLLRLERCCAHDATPFLTVICFPPGGVNTKVHWFDVVRDHS